MKAVTVNLLRDGRVAYLGADNDFKVHLQDAARFDAEEAETALAAVAARADEIADAYLVDVDDGVPAGRARLREAIRNAGPTVRADLGKQAGRP